MSDKLTGIERELVLQYLIDGNVPVTITPVEKNVNDNEMVSSSFFPVVIKDNINVKQDGKIILQNPPESVLKFKDKELRIEFYFNRVGLFFNSFLNESADELFISLPSEINRIKDVVPEYNYDFSASVYYEFHTLNNLNLNCIPWKNVSLFTKPVWKDVPLENQQIAKQYLEEFVAEAKIEKNIGYGIQLIPVCNYLTTEIPARVESMENRQKELQILYVDHQRIVLGFEYTAFTFTLNDEYGIKLSFSLKEGPIKSRDIFVTSKVNKIYKNKNERLFCVDFVYTSIQEEDLRYLYEKSTKELFI